MSKDSNKEKTKQAPRKYGETCEAPPQCLSKKELAEKIQAAHRRTAQRVKSFSHGSMFNDNW